MLTVNDARTLGLTKFSVRFLIDGEEVETTTFGRNFEEAERHGFNCLRACFEGVLICCGIVPYIGLE